MRWKEGRRSANVEDRRGMRVSGRTAAGGGVGVIVIALIAMYFGADPKVIMNMLGGVSMEGAPEATQTDYTPTPEEQELADFTSVVLADTEDVWNTLFQKMGREYQDPKLVLLSGAVQSACGHAEAAMGPFYCPGDSKVYIDLGFYNDLKNRHQAPGDFAQAYVIAHEIGHHVQNQLGISDPVHAARGQVSQEEYNRLSVRLELQADFLAGVWAHHAHKARQVLESGDVEEALNAATAIGDDRLQREARGYVVPDSFTHGTSEQRVRWFRKGLQTGDVNQGDTFKAAAL